MNIHSTTQPTKDYCNVLAHAQGFDPGGHAGHFDDAILLETPLPWKNSLYTQAGALPQAMLDLRDLWLARYHAGQPYNHRPLLVAPDPAYSVPGRRRVIYFDRMPVPDQAPDQTPDGTPIAQPFAAFRRTEYLVPDAAAGPLLWALFEDRSQLDTYARYQVPLPATTRDLLVCTHGTIDVACAKFGFPLYQHLRDHHAHAGLRVWRVSHFGGHIFAPTLMDFPTGHYWAYVGEEQAAQIVARQVDPQRLHAHYRGWAGVDAGFAQAAERALWERVGWAWFDYARSTTVLAQDTEHSDPHWMELALDYTAPTGEWRRYCARVEIIDWIETQGSTGASKTYRYAQYAVSALTAVTQEHATAFEPVTPVVYSA
ncbi:MAG: sucrase ferredoxin [Litorilinea sp.]